MDVFFSTFEAIATLLVIGIIGFTVIRRKLMPSEALSAISPLFLEVALPAMGFVKILSSFDPAQKSKLLLLPFLWVAFTSVSFVLCHLFKFLSPRAYRGEFAMTLFFQNAVFIPLIIVHKMYGPESPYLVDLFLFAIFYSPFFFNFNHIFFEGVKGAGRWNKLYHPVVVSTIVAILLVLFKLDTHVPAFFIGALSMVGAMAIPLLMVVVGGNIYLDFKQTRKFNYFEVFKFVLIKNFVFPALSLAIILIFKIRYDLAVLLLLQAAAPPLMAVPIFAERLGKNRFIVNQYIIGSISFSVLSIPLFFALFKFFIQN